VVIHFIFILILTVAYVTLRTEPVSAVTSATPTPLLGPILLFSSVISFTQTAGLLGPARRKAATYTQDSTNTEETEWDSNPRSHLSGERRQFMP
jgi:hypothetical protein